MTQEISDEKKEIIERMRKKGSTHHEIAKVLGISSSTAYKYAPKPLSKKQHLAVKRRKTPPPLTHEEAVRYGGLASHKKKYPDKEELLKAIKDFYVNNNGVVPTAQHVIAGRLCTPYGSPRLDVYQEGWGSWNKAVEKAGLVPRPPGWVEKCYARDGHLCDSPSEAIVDNWLCAHGYKDHATQVPYPCGEGERPKKRPKICDFVITINGRTVWIEYLGGEGHKKYMKSLAEKRELFRSLGIEVIEVRREDLPSASYPGRLDETLGKALNSGNVPISRDSRNSLGQILSGYHNSNINIDGKEARSIMSAICAMKVPPGPERDKILCADGRQAEKYAGRIKYKCNEKGQRIVYDFKNNPMLHGSSRHLRYIEKILRSAAKQNLGIAKALQSIRGRNMVDGLGHSQKPCTVVSNESLIGAWKRVQK